MVRKRRCKLILVIIRRADIENPIISGFFNIGNNSQNQPQRIVVEISANLIIALLCKRLILMVRATIRKLRGSKINNAFPGTIRNLMYKPQKILV